MSEPNPFISFCIPTRNFADFLPHTLESIRSQSSDDIEVVIIDGASTDHTPTVAEQFRPRFDRLIYQRLQVNGGVDRDLDLAVRLATGDYCWLMSSDDILMPGAVATAREQLQTGCDVVLFERIDCTFDMRPLRIRHWLRSMNGCRDFAFKDQNQLLDYLERITSIGGLFSYISSILVSKRIWTSTEIPSELFGTNYAHAARILKALYGGARLRYVPQPVVKCRGDNDSFSANGRVRRFSMDIDGYQAIGNILSQERALRRAFFSAVRREHGLGSLAGLRNRLTSQFEWNEITGKLLELGYSRSTLLIADILGRMGALVKCGRRMRRWALDLHGRAFASRQ